MTKIRLWAFLALPLLAISCKKDDNGSNQPVTEAYFSINSGNQWNYELTNNPTSTPITTTYSITATATDTTINARQYRLFTRSTGGNEYYYVNGTEYYEYLGLPLFGTFKFENLYLKSNAALNASWTQVIPPISFTDTTTGITIVANLVKSDTIKETGISKTVKGITYNNVVHVSSGIKIVSIAPALIPLSAVSLTTNIENYYAPKVGRISSYNDIKIVVQPPFALEQGIQAKTELVSVNF